MTLVERKDPDAFGVIYERHGGVAYSLAYRVVGNSTMAEEVTQEAFLEMWRNGARFDPLRGSVRAWMMWTVRNRAIDALRRSAGAAPKLDLDDDRVLESQPAAQLTDAEAIRRETAAQVRGALTSIPDEQSEVIGLAYFGGFSQSEIAQMLGMPLGTVKSRMRLGLEKIRLALAEGLGAEGSAEVMP